MIMTSELCTCSCHIPGLDIMHIVPCCDECYQKRGEMPPEIAAIHKLPTLREKQDAYIRWENARAASLRQAK